MKRKPEIGDTLYSLNVGNEARNREQKLTPVTVSKVGRLYFTIKNGPYRETQFRISNWREKTDFMPNQELYSSEQDYADKIESDEISIEIWKAFDYGVNRNEIPLLTLREIKRLILS